MLAFAREGRLGKKVDGGEGWGVVKRCTQCAQEVSLCRCPKKEAPSGAQRAKFRFEKRRGKPVTVITHLTLDDADLKALASFLKSRLGAGGTVEEGEVVLQGDRREALPPLLKERGIKT